MSSLCGKFNAAALEDEMQEALENRDFEAMQDLISRGADVDTQDGTGNTALILATIAGRHAQMRSLLKSGADPNKANYSGFTPLDRVIEKDTADRDGAEILMAQGATIDKNAYKTKIMAGPRVRLALAPVFIRAQAATAAATDFQGNTALHVAASLGNIALVEELLDLGSALEARNNQGHTALTAATASGQAAVVKILVKAGADIDVTDGAGQDLLKLAGNAQSPSTLAVIKNVFKDRAAAAAARRQAEEEAAQARRNLQAAKLDALRRRAPKMGPLS